jgi:hypothetical protein
MNEKTYYLRKCKKVCLAFLFFLLLVSACNNSESSTGHEVKSETESNIYRSGDSMLSAFKRKDWHAYVKYNHPNMIKRMGGPEAFASFVNMQMQQIPDSTVKNIALGKILQVVKTPGDLQCVVEQHMELQLHGSNIKKITYLVGESLDNGTTWTFFDASVKTGVTPKEIKPDISSDLKIPEAQNDAQ